MGVNSEYQKKLSSLIFFNFFFNGCCFDPEMKESRRGKGWAGGMGAVFKWLAVWMAEK